MSTSFVPQGATPHEAGLKRQEEQVIASTRGRTPRSCLQCNRRKVRCDRREPCFNCTRAGQACIYRPTRPSSRRPMSNTSSSRSGPPKTDSPSHRGSPSPSSQRVAASSQAALSMLVLDYSQSPPRYASSKNEFGNKPHEEILMDKGLPTQYFNEVLHLRAIKEGQAVLNTPALSQSLSQTPTSLLSLGTEMLFPSRTTTLMHPSKQDALLLWNTYVENVECCANLKILHTPTDEVTICTTFGDPSSATFEDLALTFAVYYSSLNSLQYRGATTAWSSLVYDPVAELARFKSGVEHYLAKANFLDNLTVTTMKALAIFLSSLRIGNRGKSIWALEGLAIRLAQSIGMHRDGERLRLTPFECEIRRRVWWHFVVRDSRAGEDYGIQDTARLAIASDVSEPLNVEDADLHPDMVELPDPRNGFTPMTFNNVNIDFAKAQEKLAALVHSSTPVNPPSENRRVQIMTDMTVRVEERLAGLHPAIPRHRLVLMVSRFVVRKLDLASRLQWLALQTPKAPHEVVASDDNLSETLDVLDMFLAILNDELLEPYVWSTKAFPQLYLLLYVFWHLCVRPESAMTQRAWEGIASLDRSSMCNGAQANPGSSGTVLATLKARAEGLRDKGQVEGGMQNVVMRDHDTDTTAGNLKPVGREPSSTDAQDLASFDFILGTDAAELPDWITLTQDLPWMGNSV
ncbi:hypothetical protein EDB81DRAFT_52712 [Dactylonectria macrodidyma]|uniref:Zn(2)-C6 fungal-type domain-containing protein n=1 Tax=Dactylonectria macrodidyma TaxID=307937 RepID=A0A9P9ER35_9HYPO|nr:hypothetical protein EDB81DRAFT_52712 [Dactylonectria macrodidyma]